MIVLFGGKLIIYNVMIVIFNLGDEVVIFVFYWVFYFDIVFLVGGKLVIVEMNLVDKFWV